MSRLFDTTALLHATFELSSSSAVLALCLIFLLLAAQLLLPPTSSFLPFKSTLHFSCLYGLLDLFKVGKDVFLLHMNSLLIEKFYRDATVILLTARLNLSR